MYVCLCIMVSNAYCVLLLFYFSSFFLSYVTSCSGLSMFGCPCGILWCIFSLFPFFPWGPGGSMSSVVGFNNSYKPITNMAWVRSGLCLLQKRCTRLAAASDKVYQLFAHGRWFSSGTPASSTNKTGLQVIAEIVLKVALEH